MTAIMAGPAKLLTCLLQCQSLAHPQLQHHGQQPVMCPQTLSALSRHVIQHRSRLRQGGFSCGRIA